MKNALAYAIHKDAKISPKKVTPLMNLIRGKSIYDAKVILALDPTKAAKILLKVVKSAESNAKNGKLATANLILTELWVGDGMVLKRGHATARGKFAPMLKRSSHLYVGLNERGSK
jgi:large subunit ribosomal protein L22